MTRRIIRPFSWWFTASEIAGLALPGMPATADAVCEFAASQRWGIEYFGGSPSVRLRDGMSSTIEYHASVLPDAAGIRLLGLEKLARHLAYIELAGHDRPFGYADQWEAFDALGYPEDRIAEQRLAVLLTVEERCASGSNKTTAVNAVAQSLGVSRSTINGWYAMVAGIPRPHWLPFLIGSGRLINAEIYPDARIIAETALLSLRVLDATTRRQVLIDAISEALPR